MKQLITILLLAASITGYGQRKIAPSQELRIIGDIKTPRTYTLSAIKTLKQTDLGDISIKNHKGEEKYVAHKVKAVLLRSLLDSVEINTNKPKELSAYIFVFTASDKYVNVYSWNEIFNTDVGNHLYLLTEQDGKGLDEMDERIQVLSMGDINTGMRRMRGLASIEIKSIQ